MSLSASEPIVLAAVDSSALRQRVIDEAAITCRERPGLQLHLVHVVDPLSVPVVADYFGVEHSIEELRARAEEVVLECAARAAGIFGGPIFAHVTAGTPAKEIVALAEQLRVERIVLGGAHAPRGLQAYFGTTRYVVLRAACAVVVVRGRPDASDGVDVRGDLRHRAS